MERRARRVGNLSAGEAVSVDVATRGGRAASSGQPALDLTPPVRGSVRQHIVVAVLEVDPRCVDLLKSKIREFRDRQKDAGYADLYRIRTLHFLSMMVFVDQRYDPVLVIEVNVDGPPGPFWAEMEQAFEPQLREMLRCCKPPGGRDGDIFEPVVAPGSKVPLAPLLEAVSVRPAAWHQGNRGVSRQQIEAEAAVFLAVREELKDAAFGALPTAVEVHQELRNRLFEKHPVLQRPVPRRISRRDNLWDLTCAAAFSGMALGMLNLPGLVLTLARRPAWPPRGGVVGALVTVIGASSLILWRQTWTGRHRKNRALPRPAKLRLAFVLSVALAFVLMEGGVAGLVTLYWRRRGLWDVLRTWRSGSIDFTEFLKMFSRRAWRTRSEYLAISVLVLLAAVAVLTALLAYLRHLERRDPSQENLPLAPQADRELSMLEDRLRRNHMGGLVHLKPGLFRAILARIAFAGLDLVIRIQPRAREGYLVNIRTIHFAHLALVSNGSRLLFLANFDGTWQHYLTDFIEKVRKPLTLVWNNGVGFPPTRFFVLEGASYGQSFKNWQRRSMAPNLFWFNAYPTLSVEQIQRQRRLALGLRKPTLNLEEAKRWALDL